ncbi:biotin-dependent carboxyltransferase family protein [Halanaerocella petrolearia]
MSKLVVERAGLLTTIQDKGRYGYQQYGMPVAGAMDKYAFQVANILAGNSRNLPALEITLQGPTIRFTGSCRVAIAGANLGAKLNGRRVSSWTSFRVDTGDRLSFSRPKEGCRAYLAVSGGLKIYQVMESSATYLRGELGGHNGRRLEKGDTLDVAKEEGENFSGLIKVEQEYIPQYQDSIEARVIIGPQEKAFSQEVLTKLLDAEYKISLQSDRMGYRLDGPTLEHQESADIISEGISLGAIQVPGDGKPIIMMADRQTTGGYTKIANVISVDIPELAQLKPGDKVGFKAVSVKTAQRLYRRQEQKLKKLNEIINKIYLVHGSKKNWTRKEIG